MGIYGDRGDLLFVEYLPGYVIAFLIAFVVQIGMQQNGQQPIPYGGGTGPRR